MKEIIERFCEDSKCNNGLMLIDMPTGAGKTHDVIEYITEFIQRPESNGRKIFFITTLIKNLPYEEIRKKFANIGRVDLFDDVSLMATSNADSALENFNDKDIPDEIKYTKEYRVFKTRIDAINSNKNNLETYKVLYDEFCNKIEPIFRRFISKKLNTAYSKNVNARKKAIKTIKEWQWIPKLYPNSLILDKKLIFMTMDKFLYPFSTIIDKSYYIYNNNILKNSIVFIDEFDATKETMLKNIITTNLERKIDFWDLFKTIYNGITNTEVPDILLQESERRKNVNYKRSLKKIAEDLVKEAREVYDLHSLKYCCKLKNQMQEDFKENFLFHDSSYHTTISEKNLIYISNDKERVNYIDFADKSNEEQTVQYVIGKLRRYINYFARGVEFIAEDYQQKKKEKGIAYTLESAVESVLNAYQIKDKYNEYLTYQIMNNLWLKSKKDFDMFDLSFYRDGFRYYSILDEDNHDLQSIVQMYSFNETPEKILLCMCSAAKVIGISATATIPTVLGNYDIKYLKWKLNKNFIELTETDRDKLRKRYGDSISYYDKVNIITKVFDDAPSPSLKKYTKNSWKFVFANDDYIEFAFEKVGNGTKNSDYIQCRYIRICMAYKEFLIHNDIKSFLCVLTKHPRPGDRELDLNVLYDLFDYIAKENNVDLKSKDVIAQLDGDDFEDKKADVVGRLYEGKKLFVISVYQTIGAGQNIQYKIPEGLDNLVHINGLEKRKEKDFDAIYLDKPTNLTINIYGDKTLEEDEFIKNIYQAEFLFANEEKSFAEKMKLIKDGFNRKVGKHCSLSKSVQDTLSYRYYVTKIIIQAIGRICRTNMKNKNIYVFADKDLLDFICTDVAEGRLLNKEFESLLNLTQCIQKPQQLHLLEDEEKAVSVSMETKKRIDRYLNGIWTDETMQSWQNLRKYVLDHPTLSAKEFNGSEYKYLYIKLQHKNNCYYFKQEGDYNKIDVKFSYVRGYECVSSVEQLFEIAKIEGVDIAEWSSNDYMMSPILYNNIYKGALGEVLGKAILENYCVKKLKEIDIPDFFERFDYVVDGLPIYIDFKLWKEHREERKKYLEKVTRKTVGMNVSCVMLINIIKSEYAPIVEHLDNGTCVIEIPCLYIYDKNTGDLNLNNEAIKAIVKCYEQYSN